MVCITTDHHHAGDVSRDNPLKRTISKNEPRKLLNPVNAKGLYHYPKRMQTGPGECNPPASGSNEMTRVKEWINQWCPMYEKGEEETI